MKLIAGLMLMIIANFSGNAWATEAESQGNSVKLNPILEAEDLRDAHSPVLQAAVQSEKISDRVAAAYAYGRILKPEGINPLLTLLNDEKPTVIAAALFNLGQLGWDLDFAGGRELEIVAKITPFLKHLNPGVRVKAVEALGKLALLQTPNLVTSLLSDSVPQVRAEAALALFRYHHVSATKSLTTAIPDLVDASLQALLALAKDPAPGVRRAVAYYFFYVKDARGFATISDLSKDSDLWTRYYSTVAFGKMGNVQANSRLFSLIADSSPIVRVAAVNSLASLNSVGLLTPAQVTGLEKDSDFHVRAAFAGAAGLTKDEVRAMLADRDIAVRSAAIQSWSLVDGNDSLTLLNTTLSDPSWVIRAASAQALENLDASAEKLMLGAAKDSDVHVRNPAIDGLAGMPDGAAYDAIANALKSSQYSERFGAVDAMASRKELTAPTDLWNAYLRSVDATSIQWDGVREEVVAQLASVPAATVTDDLKLTFSDSDPNVVNSAIQTLQSRGISTGLPAIQSEKLSFSPYRELKLSSNPRVVFETTRGRIVFELFPKEAPIHVASFVGFAQAHGYDGLPWHRLVSDYIVQGGDPDKTGFGNAGFYLRTEINARRFQRGSLSMARAGDFNGDGVQVFVALVPTPKLDGQYSVFGQVIEGMDNVDQLEVGDLILSAHLL